MAPMAGGVADREKNGLVFSTGLLERLVAPRVPIHGIVFVLKEVGTVFGRETIRHHVVTRSFLCHSPWRLHPFKTRLDSLELGRIARAARPARCLAPETADPVLRRGMAREKRLHASGVPA